MEQSLKKLNSSKGKLVSICKKLQWLFFVIFALYVVGVIAVIAYSVIAPDGLSYIGPETFIGLVPVAFNVLSGGLILFFLGLVFRGIGKGESPFTIYFSRWIILIGILLLVGFLTELFILPGSTIGAVGETSAMALNYGGNAGNSININATQLLTSVVAFALAAIFRYGAILQEEVDDLA